MKKNRLKIGIIATPRNKHDIIQFQPQLSAITKNMHDKVDLIVYGYNNTDNEQENWLKDVDFTFIKPTSIIHYFKQLKALELDLLLIPLVNNVYNTTSEDYNKFLESALLEIPVLAPNQNPYNLIITSEINGFIYPTQEQLPEYLKFLIEMPEDIKIAGQKAKELVQTHFSYSEENINMINDLFE